MFQFENVFVKPGVGVKTPLPIGGGYVIPAAGKLVRRTLHVERLIRTGDLIISEPDAALTSPPAKTEK